VSNVQTIDYFIKVPLLLSESLIPGASGTRKKPDSIPSGAAVLSVKEGN
jgi:hypothetical protein